MLTQNVGSNSSQAGPTSSDGYNSSYGRRQLRVCLLRPQVDPAQSRAARHQPEARSRAAGVAIGVVAGVVLDAIAEREEEGAQDRLHRVGQSE